VSKLDAMRDARWNFALLSLDFTAFGVGMSFASSVTVLPAFVKSFTSSELAVGLILSLSILGFNLPQILVANHVEKLERQRRYILTATSGERIPWLILAFTTLLYGGLAPPWVLVAFFLLYFSTAFSGGLTAPAWMDLVGRSIPENMRGRFFGVSNFFGTALGSLGGIAVGFFLGFYGFPVGFSLCFLSTFIFALLSWVFLAGVREPPRKVPEARKGGMEYMRSIPTVLRNDRNFSLYIVSTVFLGFSAMATAFYTAYAMDKLHPTGEEIGFFTSAFLASQAVSNILWGLLGDRKGHKIVVESAATLNIAAALLTITANSLPLFYLVFALAGAAASADLVSAMSLVLEFPAAEARPTYVAIANTLRAPFNAGAPLIGGLIAKTMGLGAAFPSAALMVVIGLMILLHVEEPKGRHAAPSAARR